MSFEIRDRIGSYFNARREAKSCFERNEQTRDGVRGNDFSANPASDHKHVKGFFVSRRAADVEVGNRLATDTHLWRSVAHHKGRRF